MIRKQTRIIDEYQNIHVQGEILGQGGQGIVFRTKDPDLAIKLLTDGQGNSVVDRNSLNKYRIRFTKIRLLPLPKNINVSIPVALLEGQAGYVMQLLSDMDPFSRFWIDGKTAKEMENRKIPDWLAGMPNEEAKKIVFYNESGGLRRRLTALYKAAVILSRLHGNGLVYGDVSPNNLFVSKDNEATSVWLIDADNIRFEVKAGGSIVYTPKYGAPELVQGKGAGTYASDCHAFAVVAFYILSMIHPFYGKLVDGSDECDWFEEGDNKISMEDKAYAGLFPWVDDRNDDSNVSYYGLPRSIILTRKLQDLLEETFSSGRTSPLKRPVIFHWPEAFAQASDTTVVCPNCQMTYYFDFIHPEKGINSCPYCSTARPQCLVLEAFQWNGSRTSLEEPVWRFTREINKNTTIWIPRRVVHEFTMEDSEENEFQILVMTDSVVIRKADSSNCELYAAAEIKENQELKKIHYQMRIDCKPEESRIWLYTESEHPRLIRCTIIGG
jgi:serine/threonine protein kinase